MGKLKAMAPLLRPMAPRLGHAVGDVKAGEKQRYADAPWRAWYGTERWKKLRQQVFVRDGYRSARSGTLCIGTYPAPNSPVANHIKPHRGDPRLFWDIGNIETVSKAEHDGEIQQAEQSMPKGQWE